MGRLLAIGSVTLMVIGLLNFSSFFFFESVLASYTSVVI